MRVSSVTAEDRSAAVARPLKRRSKIAFSVAREIIAYVAAEGLPPGSVLESEILMKDRYGISRGSLREALRVLEVVGFVYMKPGPGGGPVLAQPTGAQFAEVTALFYQVNKVTYRDLLEARIALESITASIAARNCAADEIAKLDTYILSIDVIDLSDDRQFRVAGQDFHYLIASMTGNDVLQMTVRGCTEVFAGRVREFLYPADARSTVCATHAEIARAIIRHDAPAASTLMCEHLTDYLATAVGLYPAVIDEVVRW
jgi:GntR family transcriptional repressor for pyruvate dehydrogenase complex